MFNNILFRSYTIILNMDTYTSLKSSLNHLTCSRLLKLRLIINSTKELKPSNVTMMVNTMADMTVLVNNDQVHLLNT